MRRIYLLIDEYVELTFLETLLKKIGFDATGSQALSSVEEKTLELLPDLLILSDFVKQTSTKESLEKIKKIRPQTKVLLLRRSFSDNLDHELKFIDLTLKSPVEPKEFLKHVCGILDVNTEAVLEKYTRLGLFKYGVGTVQQEQVNKTTDFSNQNQFLKKINSQPAAKADVYVQISKNSKGEKVNAINHSVVVQETQELRNRSGDTEIKKIDSERADFVRALFKK